MRTDWLPVSSAALVTGAAALFYGAQTLPRPDFQGEVLAFVADGPDGLLSPALIILLGATAVVFGLPSIFTLFGRRAKVGVLGLVLIALGAITLTGFAQQLLLLRRLVAQHPVTDADLAAVMADSLQGWLVTMAYLAFHLGELCVAWSLRRSCRVPRWIPWVLVAHVVAVVGTRPFDLGRWETLPVVLMAAGLAGLGISANINATPPGVSSRDIAEKHAREQSSP